MKKYYILFIHICLLVNLACENDFDIIKDTNQRHISFEFNTDTLFSNILLYENNQFHLVDVNKISSNKRVRITVYCYNQQGYLINKKTQISILNNYKKIDIKHLNKDSTYRFLITADVVKYNTDYDYNEVWFQMKNKTLNDFYFYSDQRSDSGIDNILGIAFLELQPENQTHTVSFEQLTYNGFCILNNLENISLLEGYISYTVSFKPYTFEMVYWGSLGYEFDYLSPIEEQIIIPITFCFADDKFQINLKTTKLNIINENTLNITNNNCRPFVITIDCDKLELTDFIIY